MRKTIQTAMLCILWAVSTCAAAGPKLVNEKRVFPKGDPMWKTPPQYHLWAIRLSPDGSEITRGHVVVPSSAVRDEGTSYHYAPPSREIAPSGEAVAAIEAALEERNVPYVLGKTWTTDGFYRETPNLVRRRKAEGCLTVEMEAASLFAMAQFRGVTLGFILSVGDDVSGEKWDDRGWLSKPLDAWGTFDLAVEACLRL